MMNTFIQGPVGQLEAIVTKPESGAAQGVAIICHPHPLYEGAMTNKVVTAIAKAFIAKAYATVRFNFRGVGQSEGSYGDMIGETEDCLAVYEWVKKEFPGAKISLAGFSFGSFISASVASQKPCEQLISVAPAVNHADFTRLKNIECPWTIFQGEQDEIVSCDEVKNFIGQSDRKINFISSPDTTHFFHGKLIELRKSIISVII